MSASTSFAKASIATSSVRAKSYIFAGASLRAFRARLIASFARMVTPINSPTSVGRRSHAAAVLSTPIQDRAQQLSQLRTTLQRFGVLTDRSWSAKAVCSIPADNCIRPHLPRAGGSRGCLPRGRVRKGRAGDPEAPDPLRLKRLRRQTTRKSALQAKVRYSGRTGSRRRRRCRGWRRTGRPLHCCR